MSSPPRRSSPTIRLSACWCPAPAKHKPRGFGPMPVTNDPVAGMHHLQPSIGSPVIARVSTPRIISPASAAGCMPTAMLGSRICIDPAPSAMVACMAHIRRKFVDIHRSQGSPIAEEAVGRIAQLHAVGKKVRGSPPDHRAKLRRTHAAPVFDDLEQWLAGAMAAQTTHHDLRQISAGRSNPICLGPHEPSAPIPRPRDPGTRQQHRRTRHARRRPRAEELPRRRLRGRRQG